MINAERRSRDLVVIGASAGGIQASRSLLHHLPASFGAAIVLVIHLDPFFKSRLPEVLGWRTRLHVTWAQEGADAEMGTVHVAPPDHHLTLEHASLGSPRLRLNRGPRQHYTRPAIDPLFISAARLGGQRVVGVLLSGANDDGAEGLIHIKRAGGVTLVQDPDEARHPRMPRSGLEHDSPDAVLSVDALATTLTTLAAGKAVDIGAREESGAA